MTNLKPKAKNKKNVKPVQDKTQTGYDINNESNNTESPQKPIIDNKMNLKIHTKGAVVPCIDVAGDDAKVVTIAVAFLIAVVLIVLIVNLPSIITAIKY